MNTHPAFNKAGPDASNAITDLPGENASRLWSSLEAIRDGFAVFDQSQRLVKANRSFLSLFEGLDAVRPGCAWSDMLQIMAEEGIVDTENRATGDWVQIMVARWAEDTIQPVILRLWNDQFFRFVERRTGAGDIALLALNITDQMDREAAMRDALDKAETANRAKSAFLATMSHELRTPMNGIIGIADVLEETGLSAEQKNYLKIIQSSGQALLVIINDILDYSRIEADKVNFQSMPFDLERSIHDVVTLLTPEAATKGLSLDVDYDLFMPTSFVGDAGRVRQVLTNLIGNAIKFTTDGHVCIRVVGLPGMAERDYSVHITVEDTGIGIAENELTRIFDEFQQVEDDQTRRYDGTGLGLTISKRLIDLMGGEIWVESTPGHGSCFGFCLTWPALEDETEIATAPEWLNRALLIDEDPHSSRILQKQLMLLGLHATVHGSVAEVQNIGISPRDVLFTTPELAPELASWLSNNARDCQPAKCIVIGTPADHRSEKQGTTFLTKPVLRSDLLKCLSALVPPMTTEPGGTKTAATGAAACLMASDVVSPVKAPLGARRMRVLMAEDNRTNRFVFQRMVNTLNIDLMFAEDGAEALRLYQAYQPDIVFTDISMPNIDGKTATRQIRQFEADYGLGHCPIVAITAFAEGSEADEILAAGVDYFLSKPLKKKTIIDHILRARPACATLTGANHSGQQVNDLTEADTPIKTTAAGPAPRSSTAPALFFRHARRHHA